MPKSKSSDTAQVRSPVSASGCAAHRLMYRDNTLCFRLPEVVISAYPTRYTTLQITHRYRLHTGTNKWQHQPSSANVHHIRMPHASVHTVICCLDLRPLENQLLQREFCPGRTPRGCCRDRGADTCSRSTNRIGGNTAMQAAAGQFHRQKRPRGVDQAFAPERHHLVCSNKSRSGLRWTLKG